VPLSAKATSGDEGNRTNPTGAPKTLISETDSAKYGAPKDENGSNLAWLTQHWPGLPEPTRKQIIATARAALNSGGTAQ
jgi:hypothetical protein